MNNKQAGREIIEALAAYMGVDAQTLEGALLTAVHEQERRIGILKAKTCHHEGDVEGWCSICRVKKEAR